VAELANKGKAGFPEIVPFFEKVDWYKYYLLMPHDQPLADFLHRILNNIMEEDAEFLIRYLSHPSHKVRWPVLMVFAEKKIKSGSLEAPLKNLVKDPQKEIRDLTVRVCEYQGEEFFFPVLKKALKEEKDTEILLKACWVLARYGDTEAKKILIKNLGNKNYTIRMRCASYLKDVKGNDVKKALIKRLKKEKNQSVIAELVCSLRSHTGQTDNEVRKKYLKN
ncbi:MAG: HEAT repeat domain-containing protein, partial [bacterium]